MTTHPLRQLPLFRLMDLLLQLSDLYRLGDRRGQCFDQTMPVLSQHDQPQALHLRPLLGDYADFDDPALRNITKCSVGDAAARLSGMYAISGLDSKQHYCRVLQVNLATARPVCPFCDIKVDEAPTDGVRSMAARFGAALADAEARVREAEERRRSAEEAARKEAELRVQAERKADEIEKKVTWRFRRCPRTTWSWPGEKPS